MNDSPMSVRGVAGALLALIASCSGCASVTGIGGVQQASPFLGVKALEITPAFALTPEVVLLGVAAYLIVDPLAPNWKIEQSEPAPGEFHLALKKKAITYDAGGDGEARQVFMRRVAALARERGAAGAATGSGYTVIEFTEGIESEFPFPRRVAYGVVQIAGVRR